MKSNLRLAHTEERDRVEIAMERINASWIAWKSPVSEVLATDGWRPVDDLASNPLDIDAAQRKSYKVIVVDAPVPLWRRLLRKVKRWKW